MRHVPGAPAGGGGGGGGSGTTDGWLDGDCLDDPADGSCLSRFCASIGLGGGRDVLLCTCPFFLRSLSFPLATGTSSVFCFSGRVIPSSLEVSISTPSTPFVVVCVSLATAGATTVFSTVFSRFFLSTVTAGATTGLSTVSFSAPPSSPFPE